jgi:predicted ArsR family transcriptional regulator
MDDANPQGIRLDATSLRVLAHPLRSRLLSLLRLHGPATATELADRLDTNTGATSYHLRKLASVGLVEDTGDGAGKRRVWAPTTRSHSYVPSDFADDPDAGAALSWLSHHYVQQMAERMGAWYDAEQSWPADWRDAAGMGDDAVLVTAQQLSDLMSEIWELLGRYRDAGAGDPSARRVLVGALATPIEPEEAPA